MTVSPQNLLAARLKESGLTAKQAAFARITALSAADTERLYDGAPRQAAAKLPYLAPDGADTGFFRLRLLGDAAVPLEKPHRYTQPKGSGVRAYFPRVEGTNWDAILNDSNTPLIATEGELKALAATAAEFPTIGLGGVHNWTGDKENKKLFLEADRRVKQLLADLKRVTWSGRNVYIAYDSDLRDKPHVAVAQSRLGNSLIDLGAEVLVVELSSDGDAKVGLDDYLVKHGTQALAKILHDAHPLNDAISRLNRRHFIVPVGSKVLVGNEVPLPRDRIDLQLLSDHDFKLLYANERYEVAKDKWKPLGVAWIESPVRREMQGIVFRPDGGPPNHYNLWRGFPVEPKEGECRLFLAHVRDVICDGDAKTYEYVLAWLADAVQNPARLPGTAIALRGKQGTGKSLFAGLFGKLLGEHYVALTQSKHLVGNFNAHTKNALLLFADEAVWAGDRSAEGTLKALVTEPKRLLEFKFRDAIEIDNFTRLILASNHDWVVPAGFEERRFLVLDVSERHMQDHKYFAALVKQMENGGYEALMHYLLHLDISKVNLRAIPNTKALLETKLLSSSPTENFIYEMLKEGRNNFRGFDAAPAAEHKGEPGWAEWVESGALHKRFQEKAIENGTRRRATETELGMALHRLLPSVRPRRRLINGQQRRGYAFPSLRACRRELAAAMRQEIDWNDDGDAN